MGQTIFRASGASNPGYVREENEDTYLVDTELGLYMVLDGMGGHNAGGVASKLARDTIHEFVRDQLGNLKPQDVLERAIQKASGLIFSEARSRRALHGMGTTVVAALVMGDDQAVIAHVGDSRAYLLRDHRLTRLTNDHTIAAELVQRRAMKPEEAASHPYAEMLSRNLGSKPKTVVDLVDVPLIAGDRLLLCSDGLSSYASQEAIEQILDGTEDADRVVEDLIALGLKGGGDDNLTSVVVGVGKAELPKSAQLLRTSGAASWWSRRELFLECARTRKLAESPICAVLSEDEAIDIVAGNLFEAVFHDLEHTTGINVWTYAENLARGWFDQGGSWADLRGMLDTLRLCAQDVVSDVGGNGESFAAALEIAVTRALIVAEMVIGGLIGERIRMVEEQLADLEAPPTVLPASAFVEHRTTPYIGAVRIDPPSPEVAACLEKATAAAISNLEDADEVRKTKEQCIGYAHQAASDFAGDSDMIAEARDIYGVEGLPEEQIRPLFETLERARLTHMEAVEVQKTEVEILAAVYRRLAKAHQALNHAIGALVVDARVPETDSLRDLTERTAELRAQVGRGETELAELQRQISKLRQQGRPVSGSEVSE